MLRSKTLGSSLTSQIAAKSAANCDARLKNILLLILILLLLIYPLLDISVYTFNFTFFYLFILFTSNSYFFAYILLSIYLLILLYLDLILMEFGYRHRAFRSNLLSKERSKEFPLQSLTQNHILFESFM